MSDKPKDKLKYFCPVEGCDFKFARPSKLEVHLRKHTGERPFVCDEPDCNKSYTSDSHLKRHKLQYHIKVRVTSVRCPHDGCHRELANSDTLKKHIERIHNTERKMPYNCDYCGKGFFSESPLNEHVYLHTGIIPYECDKCNLKFTSTKAYKRHQQNHKTYICKCGETFGRWNELRTHKKECEEFSKCRCVDTALNKPICDVCNKVFGTIKSLKDHYSVHEDVKNLYQCPIEDCGRFYCYKKNMQHHIKVYHEMIKKKIPCTFDGCDKILSSKSFNNHVNLHINGPKEKKKERAPRKDKGSHKKSTALKLTGLSVPYEAEKCIVTGEKVDLYLSDGDSTDSSMFAQMLDGDEADDFSMSDSEDREALHFDTPAPDPVPRLLHLHSHDDHDDLDMDSDDEDSFTNVLEENLLKVEMAVDN